MSFLQDAYYLIEPKPALAERLNGRTDEEFIELLMDPIVIRNREGSASRWLDTQHAAVVKLLFLAGLTDYDLLATAQGFGSILGTERIGTELFDRYWTVRRFTVDQNADDLKADLSRLISRVDRVGDWAVDTYLDSFRPENRDFSG